jgi:hypothetical protein
LLIRMFICPWGNKIVYDLLAPAVTNNRSIKRRDDTDYMHIVYFLV